MEDLLKVCIQQRNEKLLVCRKYKIDRDANSVNRTAVSEAAYRQAVQQLEGCLEDEGSCIQDSSSIFLLLLQEDVPCIRSAPLIPILLDHPIHPPLGQAVANPFEVFLRALKDQAPQVNREWILFLLGRIPFQHFFVTCAV